MYDPPIFFDLSFVRNVIAGFALTLLGALVLLAAGVWSSQAGEWLRGERRPAAWRALCALGLALFVIGIVWQLIGYTPIVRDW